MLSKRQQCSTKESQFVTSLLAQLSTGASDIRFFFFPMQLGYTVTLFAILISFNPKCDQQSYHYQALTDLKYFILH